MGICCVNYRNSSMRDITDKTDVVLLAEFIFDQIKNDQVALKGTHPQLAESGLYITKKDIETYIKDYLYYMEFKRSF